MVNYWQAVRVKQVEWYALQQAIDKANRFRFDLDGAVMASDAFFPFPDCVEYSR